MVGSDFFLPVVGLGLRNMIAHLSNAVLGLCTTKGSIIGTPPPGPNTGGVKEPGGGGTATFLVFGFRLDHGGGVHSSLQIRSAKER